MASVNAGKRWVGWRAATTQALYGTDGFYRRGGGPGAHFRTSVHASGLFALALLRLVEVTGLRHVVDVGAGRGELLTQLQSLDRTLALTGIEIADRPNGLSAEIEWIDRAPDDMDVVLIVANEWLDNVPVDVVEVSGGEWRLVEVDALGRERLGPVPDADDAAWLERWWPVTGEGDRAEIGRARDEAWAALVGSMRRGVAIAADYSHVLADRAAGLYAGGTLAGHRHGRAVPPVPDGSCDITAHVALDACAAAAAADETVLTTQRHALLSLGVDARRPPLELARANPAQYVRALSRASEAAELVARGGLGDFGWLVQSVGMATPTVFARQLPSV